jgi:hypothetical protein
MVIQIIKAWAQLDSDGNNLGVYAGEADTSTVGDTTIDNVEVATVVQLPDIERDIPDFMDDKVRDERNALLKQADIDILKYKEQVELVGKDPDLVFDNYQALLQYKQELRDIPEQPGFPYDVTFPEWPT